ncbi:MAG TPA: hypothetical protein VIF57_20235 [Polyangia bacterium]
MSFRRRLRFVVAAAAVAAAGCSAKPLQPDAGGGGTGSIDIDAGQGEVSPEVSSIDGPSVDVPSPPPDASFDITPPDAPIDVPRPDGEPDGAGTFAGRRSFDVTARIQLQQDAGAPSTIPPTHLFTLTLDGDQGRAIAGAYGAGSSAGFQSMGGGTFATTGTLALGLPVNCSGSVIYNQLTVTIDAAGNLTGSGRGQVSIITGDVALPIPATMVLTGAHDQAQPRLTFDPSGDLTDPLNSLAVLSSEPLPPDGSLTLLSTGGETIPLSAVVNAPAVFVAKFTKPVAMLRYATGYRLRTEQLQDFAANAAVAGDSFTTAALPPLVLEDGFESLVTTTYGGAQVLSAPDPTIKGTHSLYIAPTANPGVAWQPPVTLRLARVAGDAVIRFSYRIVNPGAFGQTFLLASEGGSITTASLAPDSTQPSTPAMIGSTAVTLGPIVTATFPIPADATDAVVLQRTGFNVRCGGRPNPPLPGMIIDDLRAE